MFLGNIHILRKPSLCPTSGIIPPMSCDKAIHARSNHRHTIAPLTITAMYIIYITFIRRFHSEQSLFNISLILFSSFKRSLVSHSQISTTCHPIVVNLYETSLNLSTFRSNFGIQYSLFDLGIVALLHPLCWCQKQP